MSTDSGFIVPRSAAMAGKEGWASSGEGYANIARTVKTGKPVVVRFLTNPLDDSRDETQDFVFYREVGAWNGLMGGLKTPNGMKEFPVNDVIYFEDGTRASAPRGTDLLFDSVLPGKYDLQNGRNRAQAKDVLAFNVIAVDGDWGEQKEEFNPKDGQHLIAKLSGAKGRSLLEQMGALAEDEDDFDPTAGAWRISLTGSGTQTNLILTRKTKGITPLDFEPEIIHLGQWLNELRGAVDAWWEEAKESGGNAEEFIDDDQELVDQFEQAVSNAPEVDYSVMSPARLKKLLADAGVDLPARATTAKLIELAEANL